MSLHAAVRLAPITIGLCLASSPVRAVEAASRPAAETSANHLYRTPNDVHCLITRATPDGIRGNAPTAMFEGATAQFTSPVVACDFPFNDLLPSWNVDVPQGAGFFVEIRVGRRADDSWSAFYYLGGCGAFAAPSRKVLQDANGLINVDYFQSRNTFDRVQYRVTFFVADPSQPPLLRRFSLACSNTLNDAVLAARFRRPVDPGPRDRWARRLPVPFRSQNWESDELRGKICSPTSLAMVLEFWGVKQPTTDVCRAVYDADHRMYGNWWRAIQGAWRYGVPGYLERFGDYEAVKRHIAEGRPVIASTRTLKGQLRHAPNYESLAGHLIVITGFDDAGNVLINDPAMRTPERGAGTYHPDDMAKIWLDRGGVGYVLLGRPGDKPRS